jgi:hypothetical protein
MTLPQIYERIGSLPSGGYLTVDSRFDTGYIYSLVHSARAFIVNERWKAFGKIPPIYYQSFTPDFRKAAQNDSGCYTQFFDIPAIIALDGRATGLGFVGNINGCPISFREVSSLQAFSAMQQDRLMKAGRKAYVLTNPDNIQIWYKDKIKDMTMSAVFSDPTKVPSYNINLDDYPMDVSDISKMEQYLMQGSMGLIYKTPMDRIADGKDTTVAP